MLKEVVIPCPKCGGRLMDATGCRCRGDFALEIKCMNTKDCGFVWIDAQYIEKVLDKRGASR
jgi:hypothetical protein